MIYITVHMPTGKMEYCVTEGSVADVVQAAKLLNPSWIEISMVLKKQISSK